MKPEAIAKNNCDICTEMFETLMEESRTGFELPSVNAKVSFAQDDRVFFEATCVCPNCAQSIKDAVTSAVHLLKYPTGTPSSALPESGDPQSASSDPPASERNEV